MTLFSKFSKVGFLIVVSLLFCQFAQAEYSDEIGAPADEIWTAAHEALKSYGFRKEDKKNWEMETRWTEDRVKRSGGLLKKFASQVYERRYRMKIHLLRKGDVTYLSVRGVFEIKPMHTGIAISWQKVRAQTPDYQMEQDFFMKILRQLETNKMHQG